MFVLEGLGCGYELYFGHYGYQGRISDMIVGLFQRQLNIMTSIPKLYGGDVILRHGIKEAFVTLMYCYVL